jgi:prolyl 4-hydroxylase
MQSLLGNIQHAEVESLQLLQYEPGGKFRLHYDWYTEPTTARAATGLSGDDPDKPHNRLGTVFVYLGDDCVGGETYFPEIRGVSPGADGDKFSRTDTGMGLLVKPKKGNAVFWNNLLANGTGDRRVLHAGLPVRSGTKIGLNMWSKYFPGSPMVG